MTASPLVSIAIPTYNRAGSYLPQALQSALRQIYPNVEIIVSDNGSTDHTQALVTGICDPRVRYFRHEPGIGQKANYKFCVEQAKGSYLLLLHDDDAIEADFVSSCMQAAGGASDIGIILTGVRLTDGDGQTIGQVTNELLEDGIDAFCLGWLAGKAPIYCCNTLLNVEGLREIGGYDSKHFLYADTSAIFRLAARYGRVDVREAKASFRIHQGEGGFSRKIDHWCEDSLELLNVMCELVPEKSRDQLLKDGVRFFARANYGRATTAGSPRQRLIAILAVMKYFKYRQFPSFNLLIRVIEGTRMYNTLRFIKRRAIPNRIPVFGRN